jgi:hypothetical protein
MDWSGQPAWSTSVVNDWGRDCIEQTTLYRTLRRRGQPAWLTSVANDWGRDCIEQTTCTVRSAGVVIQRGQRLGQRLYWADYPVPYAPPAWSTSVVNDWGRDCIEQTTLHRSLPRHGQRLRQRLYWADCPAPFAPPV